MSRAEELQMALSNKGWIAVVLLACLTMWLGLFYQVDAKEEPLIDLNPWGHWHAPAPSAERIAEGKLAAMNDRLRLLELRDSILKTVGVKSEPFTIVMDPAFPAITRERVPDALRRQWSALHITGKRQVVIAVVADTVRYPHKMPRTRRYGGVAPIEVFLPSAATNGACVSMLHIAAIPNGAMQISEQIRNNLTTTETIGALLSPCAFFAAFGEPGPQVREWLFNGRAQPSRLVGWNEEPSPWRTTLNGPPFYTSIIDVVALNSDPTWLVRKYIATPGISCLAGREQACGDALLKERAGKADSAWRTNVVSTSGTTLRSFYLPQAAMNLGPADGWVVSEMARTLGPEKFQKFWTSALPVDQAFRQAAGEDIQAWTHDWMVRTYGPALVGPVLPGIGVATGIFLLALAIGGAMLIEHRRTVA